MSERYKTPLHHTWLRGLSGLFCLVLGLALGWAVLLLPTSATGLAAAVQANLGHSGVSNPVTAVLLNFRSYDTLLEVAVLVLAVICVRSLPKPRTASSGRDVTTGGPVLGMLVRLLVPFMVVVAGYLLWLGAQAPGGAFQGGALLGAAWVLLLLSGYSTLSRYPRWLLPSAIILGFSVFLAVALGVMLTGGYLLEYPPTWAKDLILLIEATLTLSIACILTALFTGGLSGERAP
jgi:multisubunit Na+/H+ antiporter MnhB subunit